MIDDTHAESNLFEHYADVCLEEIVARESILYRGDAAISYGESKAGKTFGVLDLSWHMAIGKMHWHGRKITRAPVLYVALEGVDGFRKRMLAAGKVHGDPGPWFARLNVPISLVKAPKEGKAGVARIVEAANVLAAKCGQPVGMIVIDTAARAIAGDSQNDSETVMAFVQNRMGAIQQATGAAVMALHHTNRGDDIRGSLDWRNPMDVVLHWKRDEDQRTCIGEKIKDGPECVLFDYVLRDVHLGEDLDGDVITSCVIRSTPATPKAKVRKESKPAARFRKAYEAALAKSGPNVLVADVRATLVATVAVGETDADKAKKAKYNA